MYEVIGISFTNSNRVYYFSPNDIIVEKKDKVIVETERGMQIGTVVTEVINLDKEKVVLPIKTVLRKATEEDLKKQEENDKLRYYNDLEASKERGIEQGIEQGIEDKSKEVVINMLNKNMDYETISEISGKTIEEIKKIENDINSL